MTEPTPDPANPTPTPDPTPAAPAAGADPAADPAPDPAQPATGEDWKARARKHEERAKANYAEVQRLQAEVEQMRRERLSENELAILAAKDETAAQVRRELTIERVRDKFDYEARLLGVPADVVAADLEDRDLTKYLTAEGGLDVDRITAAVKRLAPAPTTPTPTPHGVLGQGGRGGTEGKTPDELAREAMARGDVAGSIALKAAQLGQLGLQQRT